MHDQGRPQNRGSCWGSPGAGCPSWEWQGGGISTRHCLQGRNFLQGGIESSVTGGKQGLIPACGDSKGSVGLGVDRQGWGRGRGPAALSRLCLASVFTRVSCPEAAWRWGGGASSGLQVGVLLRARPCRVGSRHYRAHSLHSRTSAWPLCQGHVWPFCHPTRALIQEVECPVRVPPRSLAVAEGLDGVLLVCSAQHEAVGPQPLLPLL